MELTLTLTNNNIPNHIKNFLALGHKFNLPISGRDIDTYF